MIYNIVIVEDNKELVDFIKEYLTATGEYKVEGFTSGTEAIKSIKLAKPHLIFIDLELGDIRGETVLVETRKLYNDVPIIILTGEKSQESIVNCLKQGADDYITKPFNADELLARVQARLRTSNKDASSSILTCQDVEVNLETMEVKRGNKKIELTLKEFELLKYLMRNKSMVLSRDKILNAVWGITAVIDTRVVDVHMAKLRDKLEGKSKKKLFETVRGFGYKITD